MLEAQEFLDKEMLGEVILMLRHIHPAVVVVLAL